MTAIVLTPDYMPAHSSLHPRVFLAGSIEMDKASKWQQSAIDFFNYNREDEVVVCNPRRTDWPVTPSAEDINHQVTWELEQLEKADAVVMWLEAGTLSPVSLLEFGLLVGRASTGLLNKIIVCAEPRFWRRDNVLITAERYKIPVAETFEELMVEGNNLMNRNYQRRLDVDALLSLRNVL